MDVLNACLSQEVFPWFDPPLDADRTIRPANRKLWRAMQTFVRTPVFPHLERLWADPFLGARARSLQLFAVIASWLRQFCTNGRLHLSAAMLSKLQVRTSQRERSPSSYEPIAAVAAWCVLVFCAEHQSVPTHSAGLQAIGAEEHRAGLRGSEAVAQSIFEEFGDVGPAEAAVQSADVVGAAAEEEDGAETRVVYDRTMVNDSKEGAGACAGGSQGQALHPPGALVSHAFRMPGR